MAVNLPLEPSVSRPPQERQEGSGVLRGVVRGLILMAAMVGVCLWLLLPQIPPESIRGEHRWGSDQEHLRVICSSASPETNPAAFLTCRQLGMVS